MPKKHETLQMRRERLKRNIEKRGYAKRLKNNRKGGEMRKMIQKENADKHYKRLIKLGYL